jgi:hypothetical protein
MGNEMEKTIWKKWLFVKGACVENEKYKRNLEKKRGKCRPLFFWEREKITCTKKR